MNGGGVGALVGGGVGALVVIITEKRNRPKLDEDKPSGIRGAIGKYHSCKPTQVMEDLIVGPPMAHRGS